MKPPEDVRQELVRQWLARAFEDLNVARLLVESKAPWHAAAAFHSQQAAEKFLKALLVHNLLEFPKTHNIGDLVALTGKIKMSLPADLSAAGELTPYGVEYRYPGDLPDVSETEAKEALDRADLVQQVVARHLPPIS
jgi:HEPN domain-containing protein